MTTPMQKVRDQRDDELDAEIRLLREQLFKLRWQASSGQVENPNKIRAVRRDIARHLTVLGERRPARAAGRGDQR